MANKRIDKAAGALLTMKKAHGKVPRARQPDLKRRFKLSFVGKKPVIREIK